MPPRRKKGKKVQKKGKKRFAMTMFPDEQHRRKVQEYDEEMLQLQKKLENLELLLNDETLTCEQLLEKRNSIRSRYEAAIRDKDHVLNFLTGYLQQLIEKKETFVYLKDEEQSKTSDQIASFKMRIAEVKDAAEDLGQKLAMDQIVLRGKIATLDELKYVQRQLLQNIATAENVLQERNETMANAVQTRSDGHNRTLLDLKTKSEKFAEIFRKEARKGYYLSRITKFREHLKNNLQSRILFRKFIDASFSLYQRFLHLLQVKFNLNQELEFLDNVKRILSKEFSKQEEEMRFLEEENEHLEGEIKHLEDKQLQQQELREKCAVLRSDIQNLKERDLRIQQDIKDLSKEAEEEKLMCMVLKKRCSELICILKATEEVVRGEKEKWQKTSVGFPRDMIDKLNELLDLLDTSQYENVCSYKSQIRHAGETRPFPVSLGIPTNSKYLKARKKHETLNERKIEADIPTRAIGDMSEARILRELGISRISCKHFNK